MALTKKGYYFSLTVLVLLGLLTAYFAMKSAPGAAQTAQLHEQRLAEDQAFIDTLAQDAQSALYVSGYRSLLAIDEAILKQDGYVHNLDAVIQSATVNGEINGEQQALLAGNTLNDWASAMSTAAGRIGLTLQIEQAQVTINQEDPWHLHLMLNYTLAMQDNAINAQWHTPLSAATTIPITLLNDPLYTVGTNQRYTQSITNTTLPITDFTTYLADHHYIATNKAPSYLDRLQGRLQPSPYGIESLVNLPDIYAVNIINEGSIVDWHYFGTPTTADCHLPGAPTWAVINQADAVRYDIICQ